MRIIVLAPTLLAVAACGGSEAKQERPAPLVTVGAVETRDFAESYEAVGTAVANEQVALTAPVTERVVQLGFDDGQFVRKGQMIAVLAQGQETAALAGASARAREAEQQLTRIETLRKSGFATKSSLDTQVALAAAARASAAEARASIADRVVRAPFSGYASLRRISVGAVVAAGSEITTISDISTIKLDFDVPETLLPEVRAGQSIEATAPALPGSTIGGRITAIDPVLDPATRSAKMRALLRNDGGAIKPGMLLSVTIRSRQRTAPAVPELALVLEGSQRFVYQLDKDGKAQRVPVETGARNGNWVEITKGLAPGAKIVTEGVVKLSPGAKARTGDGKPGGNQAAGGRPPGK